MNKYKVIYYLSIYLSIVVFIVNLLAMIPIWLVYNC